MAAFGKSPMAMIGSRAPKSKLPKPAAMDDSAKDGMPEPDRDDILKPSLLRGAGKRYSAMRKMVRGGSR